MFFGYICFYFFCLPCFSLQVPITSLTEKQTDTQKGNDKTV